MAPRSSWKGYLRLSLVSVPVQAFNAAEPGDGDIHLHQLHESCHSRIRYQKTCPIHGEVSNNEIVRGYEHAKGQYIIVDDQEIEKLRVGNDKAINIDTFVPPEAIDPRYFNGRTYYLLPDGPIAEKPYAVLRQALEQEGCWGIAQGVFFGHEELVAIRPLGQLLCIEMLHYHSQVRQESLFTADMPEVKVGKEEVRLASKLIEASTKDEFDISAYKDDYTDKLKQLIDAKVEGKQIVSPPQEEEAPVINLMDALKKSVAQARGGSKKAAARPPAAKPARRRRGSRRTA
jgi:DNA end-binding protein Ku